MSLLTIALATLVSEDLTCITSGLLISQGRLDPATGMGGCFIGILVGDFGLWLLGRSVGRGMLRTKFIARRLPQHRLDALAQWLSRRGWQTVAAARFLPGARFPVYVGSGILGTKGRNFLFWAAGACLVWTPLLVGTVAWLGEPIATPIRAFLGGGWLALPATVLAFFVVYRLCFLMATEAGRLRLIASVSRIWHWEFWPPWLFYLPLGPWIAYLAIRYRGLTTITAANPGIPHGGIVGESKFDILRRIPREWVVLTERIARGATAARVSVLRGLLDRPGWAFPLILKPDVGERGAGVKLIRTIEDAEAYLEAHSADALVQAYHPGPHEAGVFYYRLPGERTGHIFSVTDKRFPVLLGNGQDRVETLIRRHPRFRMQADRFLARLNGKASQVLSDGESLPLAMAGNHCQGAEFRDGAHRISPELTRRVDEIAQSFEGFFFGRFDVRYADPDAFRTGRYFAIVELNGASSESTNLYDPSRSLFWAYRVLFRQWKILFEVGFRNRALGHGVTTLRELARVIRLHYRSRSRQFISD